MSSLSTKREQGGQFFAHAHISISEIDERDQAALQGLVSRER